jgi:hypothetical protein
MSNAEVKFKFDSAFFKSAFSIVLALAVLHAQDGKVSITWPDLAPLHKQLTARRIVEATFPAYVDRLRETHATRVRLGDLDHLIFYLLQSRAFTSLPSIEPALSAKALVEGMEVKEREIFLSTGRVSAARLPDDVRGRLDALLKALGAPSRDARILYFGELVQATFPRAPERLPGLAREYFRVMRFVYQKEFVAQRAPKPAEAVADLYRARGLSTDTAVEAGFVVSIGLGIAKSLDSDLRVRRVLIVGPGLDLAPRTGLLEAGPPQSYQPWAVMDALVANGLSKLDDLQIVAADINPRVVAHIRRARDTPPTLSLVSEIGDSDTVKLSQDFRDYFAALGRGIVEPGTSPTTSTPDRGHLRRTIKTTVAAAHTLHAEGLDIVTDRLREGGFDLIVATNILPYFDDSELMLALANIAGMLAPGGVFLHNESRPGLGDMTTALGMPYEQSRHVVIATVRGAPAPLFDSVWLHRKARAPQR